jgi:prevent-host-death family protein
MRVMSSRELQKSFGMVANWVTAGESVRVTKHGRPAFFIIPENEDSQDLVRQMAANRLSQSLATATSSVAAKALTFDDVGKMIDECFV